MLPDQNLYPQSYPFLTVNLGCPETFGTISSEEFTLTLGELFQSFWKIPKD